MKIIEERMRRNCESALTKYTIKAYKKHKTINKLKPNGLFEKNNISYSPDLTFKIPIVHQYGQTIPAKIFEEMNNVEGSFKENVITIENALIKVETKENIDRIIQNAKNDIFSVKIKEEVGCNDLKKIKIENDTTENKQNIEYNYVPVSLAPITSPMTMVLVEHPHPQNLMTNLQPLRKEVIIEEVKYEPKTNKTTKWPGVEEVLSSYQAFQGGKDF